MNEKEIRQLSKKVQAAVDLFIKNDIDLLKLRVYEPAISHRISVYLEKMFNDENFNYDCEYNKYFDLAKSMPNGKEIRPDILIHKRHEKDNNVLVIEIKKKRKCKWDEDKLKELTSSDGKFKYDLGVFIYFPKNLPKYKWFFSGKEINLTQKNKDYF